MIKRIIQSAKYALQGSTDRKYPDTYIEELEFQCSKIITVGLAGSAFIWLPYYFVDQQNYPNQPEMGYIRLGLTPLAIILYLVHRFARHPRLNIVLLMIIGTYIQTGATAVALLSGGDPAYIGGIFIVMLFTVLVGPLPYHLLALVTSLNFALLILGSIHLGINYETNSQKYSLRDMGSVAFLCYLFGYIQHRIRRSHFLRAKEIERQKGLIEAKEAESKRLLLNILPESIADELIAKGFTKPIRIESATVVFTDFVGFTRISENLAPEAVVDELDKCFSYFDQVTEKYGLEKLKTIGDSFMCAGGLPTANSTHAIDCCLAALEIQAFMNQMKEIKQSQGFDYWELRLGINTGPLVAGVVGHKKFAYDVWGDTVNTASRLESSGAPGKINLSLSTYEAAREMFSCEHRGQVTAKNKGDIDMYFLSGIRPEFSIDGEGRVPNTKFKEHYEVLNRAT